MNPSGIENIQPEMTGPQPRILRRADHIVSRRNIDENALKVLYRLHNHGFLAYLVGGSVRDLLLRKKPKDFDVVTDARPSQVKKLFRNSRIIGRRFRLAHVFFRGPQIIEVSTFRQKAETNGDHDDSPVVWNENSFGSPAEDALRRDLTINGLFYNIADYSIIDFVGGLDDLENKVARVIGDPDERYKEDPVRMIRTIRHAARTGFSIDPDSWKGIQNHKELIADCSHARVREEFMRELRGGWASKSFPMLFETGLIYQFLPDFESALAGPNGERVMQELTDNLSGVDSLVNEGAMIDDNTLMAAVLSALTWAQGIYDNMPRGGRQCRSAVHRRLKENIKPIIRDQGVSKGNAEHICQMIFAQFLFEQALSKGNLPAVISRKGYFGAGVRLAQIQSKGKGQNPPRILIETAKDKGARLLGKSKPQHPRRPRQRRKYRPKNSRRS